MGQDFCTTLHVCFRVCACLLKFKGNLFKNQLESVEKSACMYTLYLTVWNLWLLGSRSSLSADLSCCISCLLFSVLLSLEAAAKKVKELDTINSPQTSIATFVYLSFLSVLALQPSLRLALLSPPLPSPLTSCSPLQCSPGKRGQVPTTPPLLVPQVNQRRPRNTLAKRDPASPYGLAQKSSF